MKINHSFQINSLKLENDLDNGCQTLRAIPCTTFIFFIRVVTHLDDQISVNLYPIMLYWAKNVFYLLIFTKVQLHININNILPLEPQGIEIGPSFSTEGYNTLKENMVLR
jgi:hypothetical protein